MFRCFCPGTDFDVPVCISVLNSFNVVLVFGWPESLILLAFLYVFGSNQEIHDFKVGQKALVCKVLEVSDRSCLLILNSSSR